MANRVRITGGNSTNHGDNDGIDAQVSSKGDLIVSLGGSSITAGNKDVTTGGSAVKLTANATPCKEVIIVAKSDNTGKIYVGGSSVSSTDGAYIFAGATMRVPIDDVSKIYIDADSDGEGVQYTYVT